MLHIFIHFLLLYFFPNECPGLCRQKNRKKNKVARNENKQKTTWGLTFDIPKNVRNFQAFL